MLSKKCKYALKALIALAKRDKSKPEMRIGELSEQEKIPKKFLENILAELRNNGIVSSKLGKTGGYYLFKKPEAIYFSDIIRIMDGPIALLPCASLNYYNTCDDCEDEQTCGLRKVMLEERIASLSILSNTSIAKAIKKEQRLIKSKRNIVTNKFKKQK
jgi:Rrf2 family protein